MRAGLLRAAVLLLLLPLLAQPARAQIVSASKGADGGVCFVGPYGWTCDPSDFDSAAVASASIAASTAGAATASASAAAAVLANAPACSNNCTADCTPPCPPACAALKFQARSARRAGRSTAAR